MRCERVVLSVGWDLEGDKITRISAASSPPQPQRVQASPICANQPIQCPRGS
jgi:hypothetical protein